MSALKKVTARFYVAESKRFAGQTQEGWAPPAPRVEVVLRPVSGNRGKENEKWASATPSGEIRMTIGNPAAAAWFDEMLGRDIAITFEERPVDETRPGV